MNFIPEQIEKIDSLLPDLHALKQNLEGAVHPDHIARIQKMMDSLSFALSHVHQAEEDAFDKEQNALSDISDEHHLASIWSMSKVKASQMHDKMPYKIGTLHYHSWGKPQKRLVNKTLTWLEAWKLCDELISQSGDSHHIFIESIVEDSNNKGHFKLETGS